MKHRIFRSIRLFAVAALAVAAAACSKDDANGGGLATPSNVTCTDRSNTTLTFTWSSVPGVQHYNYQWADSKDRILGTATTTGTSAQLTGLGQGTTYHFRVQAATASGTSLYSEYAEGMTTSDKLPTLSKPTASFDAESATENSLKFTWTAVDGAAGYSYKLTGPDSKSVTGQTTETAAEFAELAEDTEYTFTVKALGTEGVSVDSDWSAAVKGSTLKSEIEGPGGEAEMDIKWPGDEGTDNITRAFPGAEGGGMYTTGGRGGKVIHVTNLNDDGVGSLRHAISQSGARTIVFDVAGVIELKEPLRIRNGDVTIAGQTAPGDGICLKNYTFRIDASNVIVRFIRCRMGDEAGTEDDAMQVMNHTDDSYKNIIIDHCSVSWSTDECASFYGMRDFTFQWNLVSESLRVSVHEKGTHGYGGIWGGNNATYHHNLLAHHDSRNPRIDHDYVSTQKGPVSIFNNVVYNWYGNTCYGGESSDKYGSDYRKYNFFNNYYKPGPATPTNHIWFLQPTSSCSNCGGTILPGHFYMDGNVMEGYSDLTANNWLAGTQSPIGVYFDASKVDQIKTQSAYSLQVQQTIHSGDGCLKPVLDYAGASLVRDAIDQRIAQETEKGTYTYMGASSKLKGLIDTQSEVGGWPKYSASTEQQNLVTDSDGDGIPDYYEKLFGLDPNDGADGNKTTLDKTGRYTNLEMYLHYLVQEIVAAQVAGGTTSSLY